MNRTGKRNRKSISRLLSLTMCFFVTSQLFMTAAPISVLATEPAIKPEAATDPAHPEDVAPENKESENGMSKDAVPEVTVSAPEAAAGETVGADETGGETVSGDEAAVSVNSVSEDVAAGSESYTVGGGKIYFDKTTGKITGSNKAFTDLEIPGTLGEVAVTVIGEGAFQNCENLTSVIIPGSVQTIEAGAFSYNEKLKTVTMSDGVKTIGNYSFQKNKALTTVTLPKSLDSIGEYAFRWDEALINVILDGKAFDPNDYSTVRIEEGAFTDTLLVRPDFSPAYKTGEWYENLVKIKPSGDYLKDLFAVAESQMGYHEGDWLSEQDGYGKGRGDYSEYTYWWGERGHMWCGEYVGWCIAMASIPEEVFQSKYSTKNREYDWEKTSYSGKGDYELKKGDVILFKYNGGNHIILVESVSREGDVVTVNSLNGNHSNDVSKDIYTINASDGKTINEWTSINGHVDTIYSPDFSLADAVTKYTVTFNAQGGTCETASKQLTNDAFYGIMPEPVKGNCSFDGWFTAASGGERVTSYQVFTKGENQTLYAHWTDWSGKVNSEGQLTGMPNGWTGGKIPSTIGGVNVTSIGKSALSGKADLKEVVIPEGVTSIGNGAFNNNKGLKYVKFPKTLKTIGDYAFSSDSGLNGKINIPEGVEDIGVQAFANCYNLESVSLPSTIKTIGQYCFNSSNHIKEVTFGGSAMKTVKCGRGAFQGTLWLHPNFSGPYRKSEFYKKLNELDLTGEDYAQDAIKIGASQEGYHEGNNFTQMDGSNPKGNDDFVEPAYFNDSPSYRWSPGEEEYQYGGWCGNYCTWIMQLASFPHEIHAYWTRSSSNDYEEYEHWEDTVYAGKGGTYKIKAGDLLKMPIGHWCIVTADARKEGDYVYVDTWNGNDSNDVAFSTYKFRASDGYNQGLADELNKPENPDYDYGWKYSVKGIGPYEPEKIGDAEFHTVYFDVNGGKELPEAKKTKKLASSAYFGIMPIPEKEGYIFDGWFTHQERDCGVKITSYRQSRIDRDIRLYAHWRTADEDEEEPDGTPGPGIPKGSEDDPDDPINPTDPTSLIGTREKDYEIDENGIITKSAYDVVNAKIPNPIRGITVKGIAKYAFGTRGKLTTVVIPSTCTDIETYAFWNCKELSNLTVGNGVKNIGTYAFGYAKDNTEPGKLKKVTIGTGVKKIEKNAFFNRSELEEVIIYAPKGSVSIESGAFPSTTKIIYEEEPVEEPEEDQYTVIFLGSDGKQELYKESVKTGETVSKVPSPSGSGVFAGWIDTKTGRIWDPTTPVTENLTVRAKFVKNGESEEEEENTSGRDSELYIKKGSIYLVKGQQVQLPESVSGNKAVWKTADKSMVAVSGKNRIRAVKVTGSKGVKVYDGDSPDSCNACYNVIVSEPYLCLAADDSMAKIKKTLNVVEGSRIRLKVAGITGFEENYPISWYSSNIEKASVTNGVVSGLQSGSAKITAYIKGKAYSCNVSVKTTTTLPKTIGSQITLMPLQSATLKTFDDGFKIRNASWTSSLSMDEIRNANGKKILYYQDKVVRITPAGKITAVGKGETTLTGTAADGKSKKTLKVTVKDTPSQVVYINEGRTKALKHYNVKAQKATWSSADTAVAGITTAGKLSGAGKGKTKITCTYDPYETGGFTYITTVFVEAPKLKGEEGGLVIKNNTATKGELKINPGSVYAVKLEGIDRPVVFNGNKNNVAFMDDSGVIHARSVGKSTFSANVNGTRFTLAVIVEQKQE